ncbi:hypothetical protein GJ496_002044 [Pomphorhynchus laevis]|nr:hypothetical protein GJ496_002044 [Pomphorhynchus laevis]
MSNIACLYTFQTIGTVILSDVGIHSITAKEFNSHLSQQIYNQSAARSRSPTLRRLAITILLTMLPNIMTDDGQDQNDIIRGKRPCRICQRDIALTTNGCFRFHKFSGSRCPGSDEGLGCFDYASKLKVFCIRDKQLKAFKRVI